MANQSKGRKFGRNKKSPSAKNYIMAKRSLTNKAKKLRKHVKRHPSDVRNASILKNNEFGQGHPINFPIVTKEVPVERVVFDHLVKPQNRGNIMYMVYSSGGQLVDITPHYKDAEASYNKLNTDATFCKREGKVITIMQRKKPTAFVVNSYKLREFVKA